MPHVQYINPCFTSWGIVFQYYMAYTSRPKYTWMYSINDSWTPKSPKSIKQAGKTKKIKPASADLASQFFERACAKKMETKPNQWLYHWQTWSFLVRWIFPISGHPFTASHHLRWDIRISQFEYSSDLGIETEILSCHGASASCGSFLIFILAAKKCSRWVRFSIDAWYQSKWFNNKKHFRRKPAVVGTSIPGRYVYDCFMGLVLIDISRRCHHHDAPQAPTVGQLLPEFNHGWSPSVERALGDAKRYAQTAALSHSKIFSLEEYLWNSGVDF